VTMVGMPSRLCETTSASVESSRNEAQKVNRSMLPATIAGGPRCARRLRVMRDAREVLRRTALRLFSRPWSVRTHTQLAAVLQPPSIAAERVGEGHAAPARRTVA
jgi:hypothetical protein